MASLDVDFKIDTGEIVYKITFNCISRVQLNTIKRFLADKARKYCQLRDTLWQLSPMET